MVARPSFHSKTMTKKYKSNSTISITVILPNGGRAHVTFTSVTGGSSEYLTKDVNMMNALESHPSFGRKFRLAEVIEDKKVEAPAPAPKKEAEPKKKEKKVIDVEVTCSEDAKEYLADKFGLSRSKLRNREQIQAAGEANGVNFIFK